MAVTQWATREKVTVVAWHTDAGVSGAAGLDERPGLTSVFADLATHRDGVLVVARRDRLARDVVIAATIERTAAQYGARVISADGVGNGDSPADQFMRTILDGAAAYERALIRQRTRAQGVGRKPQAMVLDELDRHLEAIEELLAGADWLVGGRLTLADLAVASQLRAIDGAVEGRARIAAHPTARAWLVRVDEASLPAGERLT